MTMPGNIAPSPATPQPVGAPLTRAAIFLVVTVNPGVEAETAARALCADLAGLVRSVGFRGPDERLSCIMGVGSNAWDRLFAAPRPAELHPFQEIIGGPRHAVATPGDLLFHIRAERMDLCFELATQIVTNLGDAVATADEVHGFRYFDARDLLGFVDGTENPGGALALESTLIGEEDAASPVAAMSSCRNICTTSPAGTHCRRRRRNASSAARSCPTSSWTTRSSRPPRTTR